MMQCIFSALIEAEKEFTSSAPTTEEQRKCLISPYLGYLFSHFTILHRQNEKEEEFLVCCWLDSSRYLAVELELSLIHI